MANLQNILSAHGWNGDAADLQIRSVTVRFVPKQFLNDPNNQECGLDVTVTPTPEEAIEFIKWLEAQD